MFGQIPIAPPIYVAGTAYNPLSGGVRALHRLCHHLNQTGFEAYLVGSPDFTTSPTLCTPILNAELRQRHKAAGLEPIAVYPEVTWGNPFAARTVVRYLLNRPGLLKPGVVDTYGPKDLFFAFAPEHVIPGTEWFDLFMPIVDRSIYFPPPAGSVRAGVIVVSNRTSPDPSSFPSWAKPVTAVSHAMPITAPELADLYRQSLALVTFERSTSIYEALMCGCPVICVSGDHFVAEAYQPRFKGLGLVWGWRRDRLPAATEETAAFRAIYSDIEANIEDRLKAAIIWVLEQR